MEELTIKDVGDGKGFKLNFTQLKKKMKECSDNKFNTSCRVTLKDMGIEFVD